MKDFNHITRERRLRDIGNPGELQMRYFGSPSVFNFYRPGYVPPRTLSGEAGLTVPEFQLFDTTFFLGYSNFMLDFVYDNSQLARCFSRNSSSESRENNPCRSDPNNPNAPSFTPDYTREMALADSPTELVNHLDILLTSSQMLEETRESILEALASIELIVGSASEQEQREARAKLAVFMVVTSPSYMIIR